MATVVGVVIAIKQAGSLNRVFYAFWAGLAAMTIVAVAWILTQEEEQRRSQRLKRAIGLAVIVGVGTVAVWWVIGKLDNLRFT